MRLCIESGCTRERAAGSDYCYVRKVDMKRRGLASPDLGDRLAMTFAVDIAFRSQRPSQLVYHFPSPNAWMG